MFVDIGEICGTHARHPAPDRSTQMAVLFTAWGRRCIGWRPGRCLGWCPGRCLGWCIGWRPGWCPRHWLVHGLVHWMALRLVPSLVLWLVSWLVPWLVVVVGAIGWCWLVSLAVWLVPGVGVITEVSTRRSCKPRVWPVIAFRVNINIRLHMEIIPSAFTGVGGCQLP